MELPTALEQRIALLEQEISGLVAQVWNLDRNYPPGWTLLHQIDHPLQPWLEKSLQQLRKRWSEVELGTLAADMYFNPLHWQYSYSPGSPYEAVMRILTACLVKFSPLNICDRLTARFQQILAHPFYTDEVLLKQRWFICGVPHLHLAPALEDCLELLLALPPSSENLDLSEQLVLGEMNFGPFDPSRYFGKMIFPALTFTLYEQSNWQNHFDPSVYSGNFNSCKSIWAYQIYGHRFCHYSPPGLCEYFPRLMERLFEHGRFSYAAFCQSVQHLPVILSSASNRVLDNSPNQDSPTVSPALQEYSNWHTWKTAAQNLFHNQVSPVFSRVILEYCDRLGWETAQNLSKDNYNILTQIKGLCGSRYLLQAALQHSINKLGKLLYPHQPGEYDYRLQAKQIKLRDRLAAAVIHLALASDTEPQLATERQALIAQLKTFPSATLKYLLPIAIHSQHILCEALGWQQALPLIESLNSITSRSNTSFNARRTKDLELMEVSALRSALEQAGEVLAGEVWTLWREAKVTTNSIALLIEAIAGWNRAEIENSLPKRKQLAVKAYGLLPLERGQDEVQCYLFLKQFAQESKKFGSERQSSEQAAVQVALTYLAQTAGYHDITRLEWAMEARLIEEITPANCNWVIGDYQIELSVNTDIQLTVRRGDKLLKSVPAIVRQSQTYVEIKDTVQQLRSQVVRFRRSFEAIMATEQPLSCEELTSFSKMPIAQGLLNQLVLFTDDNTCGLFVPDVMAVRTVDGTLKPVTDQVYIAHPYHLFHKGELARWQQEIVRHRIVQPFKQVFRELYLLTPAEAETCTYSNRFAGHTLDSRVVARLLQSRGWQTTIGEYPVPYKAFPQLGIQASFEFSDVGHYISETDVIKGDRIYFQPYPVSQSCQCQRQDQWLPLAEVPPLIFSEVMCDADLVVSVAQREGEVRLSEEAYQRRGDLVKVLLADLGLPGVTVEKHFAYVQGKLASYRVHLGSAAIHIEPGHYLCIVPERWGQRHERLFIPFIEQGDTKISEVISKVLLLTNDNKIKDQSILRQIQNT